MSFPLTRLVRNSLFRIWHFDVTIGGVLFFCLIYALLAFYGYMAYAQAANIYKKFVNTGNAACVAVVVIFSIAGRNSLWGFLLVISYERIAVWHKVMSVAVVGLGILHAFAAWP